ncbi:hypothetical protein BH10PSE19_BH10PSE19_03430 [soil metagenome]
MRFNTIFLLTLLSISIAHAAPQQYVAAEPSIKSSVANPNQQVAIPIPQNSPSATLPPLAQTAPNGPIVINQEAAIAHQAAVPAAPPVATVAVPAQTGSSPPNANQTNVAPQLTESDKQTWFSNCLSGAKSQKAKAYAQQFCDCGWRHISAGELPVNLLDTSDPTSIKDRDIRMRVISQQCGVELLSGAQQR